MHQVLWPSRGQEPGQSQAGGLGRASQETRALRWILKDEPSPFEQMKGEIFQTKEISNIQIKRHARFFLGNIASGIMGLEWRETRCRENDSGRLAGALSLQG